jgi:hypothetical protein
LNEDYSKRHNPIRPTHLGLESSALWPSH